MLESWFGIESVPVRILIGIAIICALMAVFFWALRRFGGHRLGTGTARGRQPRLAVIDAAPVDARRKLVLIRRDNVEHLVMIGGPTDVIVEHNIVRAVPVAPREAMLRPAGDEGVVAWPPPEAENAAPRPAPRPQPQPEPEIAARAPRPSSAPAPRREPDMEITARGEPASRGPRTEPRTEPRPGAPRVEPRAPKPDVDAPAIAPMSEPDLGAAVPPPTRAERPERTERPERPERTERPAPTRPEQTRAAEPNLPPEAKLPPDASLTEMAQRLEAALRRPAGGVEPRVEPTPSRSAPAEPRPSPPPAADARPDSRPAPARDTKPAAGKSVFDSLEEEMANLLGKPTGKS
jgi:hypothetical protein